MPVGGPRRDSASALASAVGGPSSAVVMTRPLLRSAALWAHWFGRVGRAGRFPAAPRPLAPEFIDLPVSADCTAVPTLTALLIMVVAVIALKPTAHSYTLRIAAIDGFGHRGTTQPFVMQDTTPLPSRG